MGDTLSTLDARPCADRGWHDPRAPVCDCGHRWTCRVVEPGRPDRWTDAEVAALFAARYGQPTAFRFEVGS